MLKQSLDRAEEVVIPSQVRSPFAPEPWAEPATRFAPWLRPDDPRIPRLAKAHMDGDPLADALVEWMNEVGHGTARPMFERALEHGIDSVPRPSAPLVAFFESVDRVPDWFDRARAIRAGAVADRVAGPGEYVLFSISLLAGYVSAGIAKTLVGTAALEKMAPRRLIETAKFVDDVYRHPGLDRFSASTKTTLRVRVMHSMVRRQLLSRGFDVASWGIPINQADMAATIVQFSTAFLVGLEMLGFSFTTEEKDDLIHLWRRVGSLMGVRDDLLAANFREGRECLRMTIASQSGPNEDSRALVRALLRVPTQLFARDPRTRRIAAVDTAFRAGLARAYLGDEAADLLGLPHDRWRYGAPVLRPFVSVLERAREQAPLVTTMMERFGRSFSEARIELLLDGRMPEYVPHRIATRS